MIAILDIDGTLVDTNYHHAIAWYRAFRQHDQRVPVWRIHRHARDLIADLKDAGHRVVLASSAKEDEVEHYLDLLDARDLTDDWTSSADVEETKPAPDLVQSALHKVGGDPGEAVMIGDTTWDIEAAEKAGLPTVAVMTGGFSEAELREAGAIEVFDSAEALRAGLSQTPLG